MRDAANREGAFGSAAAIHDVVIGGAGAAGCVLAARLSEDPGTRVALIEAGADTPPDAVPDDIADTYPRSYFNPEYFWPSLRASGRDDAPAVPYLQARVMGGGSSVMGMWAMRATPADYDAWRDAGGEGWGWDDVLPSFNRLEDDIDYAGPLHGGSGPIPIRRHASNQWPGFVSRLAAAAGHRSLASRDDINADFADGVFPVPVANDSGGCVSAAAGYLTAAVHRRRNLTNMARTEALSVVVEANRTLGVRVQRGGLVETIAARETILSAGGIGSPALLMPSGIDPGDALRAVGVEPLVVLPVGRGLQNHCVVNLAMPIAAAARQAASLRTYGLACARLSSGHSVGRAGDLHLQFTARTGPRAHGQRLGIAGAALYAPRARGSVTLTSHDVGTPPKFRLLDDLADRARLASAVAFALGLLDDERVRAIRGDVFAVMSGSLVRRLNGAGTFNRVAAAALAELLDAPAPFLRRMVLNRAGKVLSQPLSSTPPDDLLEYVTPIFHRAGTGRMGGPADSEAVVDASCRVRGVDR